MLAQIKGFFLDYLRGGVRLPGSFVTVTLGVPSFLVEWLVRVGSSIFLFYDVIRGSTQVL